MSRMPKIPKNRSDKEMFAGYVEDDTLESRFKKAEKEAVQKKEAERKKQIEDPETPADLLRGGFSKELTNHPRSQALTRESALSFYAF